MSTIRNSGLRRAVGLIAAPALVFVATACATPDAHPASEASRPASARSEAPLSIAGDAGLGLGSLLANLAYAPMKLVFAAGGLLAGGATWAVTGGNSELAADVMRPALRGDYVLTPRHLSGLDPIQFVGGAAQSRAAYARAGELPPVSAGGPALGSPCAMLASYGFVTFGPGETRLGRDDELLLRRVASTLATCPDVRFRIEGHTDALGEAPGNFELSLRRAEIVKEFLVEAGVADWRLQATGLGESQPRSPNDTPRGRAANRRVEITPP